jgi:hypothetical protein
LNVALATKDCRAIADILTLMKERGFELPDINGSPEYAEFVKSPEYQDWLLEHGVAQQPEPEYSPWPRQTY